MYRYGQVEVALIRLYCVPEPYRAAFNAKLKYFRRIGIANATPGKGSKVEYKYEDVALWAVCLELAQFGIDPNRIAMMREWLWLVVGPAMTQEELKTDLIFAAVPNFLVRETIEQKEGTGRTGQGLAPINWSDPRMIYKASELQKMRPTRAMQINLSDLRRRLLACLAEVEE